MKFSEIVLIREQLKLVYNTSRISAEETILNQHLCGISDTINDGQLRDEVRSVATDLNRVQSILKHNQDRYTELITHLDQRIREESAKFFTDNYKLELKYNAVENIRHVRVMPISPEVRDELINKIQLYTDWKYPALEIGCRDGEWTQHLVAADPLYIVDHHREFVESATKDFPETYKNRIRVYLTDEHDLSTLPENQMNFVFCWNFLNYSSFDTVKEYLKEVKRTLRPGGVFLFSYNDGDRPGCAGMAENFFMSYIPKSMLIPLCESLGFELVGDHARDQTVSWLELRKPGELTTNKAHQVLGEIKHIRL